MNVIEILKRARALIEKGWTQGVMARDKEGFPCTATLDRAASFCAIGAIACASFRSSWLGTGALTAIQDQLRAELRSILGVLPGWNDSPRRTKQDVLDLFTRTIERLELDG